jgi:chemotaxis protein methyltransferase CheR
MSTRAPLASASALSELATQIAQRTGLTGLTLSHENLQRALSLSRVAETSDLESTLRDGRMDWGSLIDALTIRETYFFRHPEQFDELRRNVLPQLLDGVRRRGPLRVWSAGCASGEEAYTLAIFFDLAGIGAQVQVVGSDISLAALERGRAGHYRDWSLRSLQPELRARYFRSEGGLHYIDPALRDRVVWRQLNLAEPGYPSLASAIGHFPLILCRNVLIYFDAMTIAQVAARLWASLAPGGWLLLGPSDPNLAAYAPFEVHITTSGLLYRRPSAGLPSGRQSSKPPLAAEALAQPVVDAARTASLRPRVVDDLTDLTAQIRATCNAQGTSAAIVLCESALQRCETSSELHHLHALLLWEQQQYAEATAAMRRVLYLERDNAIAHFGLAALLERQGSLTAARRAYQNAAEACERLAPDVPLPLGDGICASGLHAAAADGLMRLRDAEVSS